MGSVRLSKREGEGEGEGEKCAKGGGGEGREGRGGGGGGGVGGEGRSLSATNALSMKGQMTKGRIRLELRLAILHGGSAGSEEPPKDTRHHASPTDT